MKSSRILNFMTREKWTVFLLILISTSNSEGQTDINPPAGLQCISKCDTCPVICSPPSSTPKSPDSPPPVHHHSPPPSSPPTHPSPPPPSGDVATTPPPPALNAYNPGITVQQNFSNPYYYFYSKASCSRPLHEGFVLFVLFMFFQVLYTSR
ncbi:hypothetical protein BUALT_Bualt10G0127300 [Buddleja alternifolia]|uniref:Uncharacterized protein n=1 Tax=Buddleja alternifolia TaxID=168488 RepID=A0AAV6X2W0_9LAMI|nr:hypothetical protein BUALT_Bualt10G0127300 [Buddleja alternifolia]